MICKRILLLLLILGIILITFGCSADTKKITYKGPSMMETFQNGDGVTISLLPYTPKQFDIIAIQPPDYDEPIVLRIIAVEGQTIDFDFENWIVYVNGEALDETYVNYRPDLPMYKYDIDPDTLPIIIEPGKIFVMGDNRDNALDSRSESIGQVAVEFILGNVIEVEFIFTNPVDPIIE
jgi:signal peptidase I